MTFAMLQNWQERMGREWGENRVKREKYIIKGKLVYSGAVIPKMS